MVTIKFSDLISGKFLRNLTFERKMTIVTDRSHGVSSVELSQIEIMVQRRKNDPGLLKKF